MRQLMVQEWFYSNQTGFIGTAIRTGCLHDHEARTDRRSKITLIAACSQPRRFGLWPTIGAIRVLVQKSMVWRIISLAMAVCWRCSSAVQRPRMAPAQLLAALSQRLIQGLRIGTSFNQCSGSGAGDPMMSHGVARRGGLPIGRGRNMGSGRAAAWHHAVGEHRMHNARAAAEPAGDRAQHERDEGHQCAGRDRRGGGVRGFGGGLLGLGDRLLVLLLERCHLLARLLERDVAGLGQGLGRLLAGLVGVGGIARQQLPDRVNRGVVEGLGSVPVART